MSSDSLDVQLLDSVLIPKARWERLQRSHKALREACEAALAHVTDERIGTITYMESSDIYSDLRVMADILRAAIELDEER